MHPFTFDISFRIRHPSDGLDRIYDNMQKVGGLLPGRIWKVGEPRKTVDGKNLEGTYHESYCFLKLYQKPQTSEIETPSEAIQSILESIGALNFQLKELVDTGGHLEFFIGIYSNENSSVILLPDLMRQLGSHNIALAFDIYPASGNGF